MTPRELSLYVNVLEQLREHRPLEEYRNRVGVSVFTGAVAYVAMVLLLRFVGLPDELLAGLFVLPALVFGRSVVVGGLAGIVLLAVSTRSLGVWTILSVAEFGVLTLSVHALWGRLGFVARESTPSIGSRRDLAEYLGALLIGTATTLGVVGWLAPVAGVQPFYTAYLTLIGVAAVVAVVGVPVLVFVDRWEDHGNRVDRTAEPDRPAGSAWRSGGLALVATGWFVAGTGLATVVHDFGQFENRALLANSAAERFGTGTIGAVGHDVMLAFYLYGEPILFGTGLLALAALSYLWPVRWRVALREWRGSA